jgi:hypothetical protein
MDWYWQKTQKTDPTSRQRGQNLAGLRWRGPVAIINYRPVLSSERAIQNNKPQQSKRKSQGERKLGRGSQMGAWHQDGLADWLSVVMWLWLWPDLTRPPLWTSGQSSWLHNGDVLCFLRGTNWIYIYIRTSIYICYIYIRVYIYTYEFVPRSSYLVLNIYIYIYVRVYIYIYMLYIYTYEYIYVIYIYEYIYIRTSSYLAGNTIHLRCVARNSGH